MRAIHFPVADIELEAEGIEIGRHQERIYRDYLVFDPHLAAAYGDLADDAEFGIELAAGFVSEDGRQTGQLLQRCLVQGAELLGYLLVGVFMVADAAAGVEHAGIAFPLVFPSRYEEVVHRRAFEVRRQGRSPTSWRKAASPGSTAAARRTSVRPMRRASRILVMGLSY